MVTGDNIETATAIAKECGILKREYILDASNVVIDGKRFRETVGGLKTEISEDGKEVKKIATWKNSRRS